jgi:hypothetical protein
MLLHDRFRGMYQHIVKTVPRGSQR